MIMPEADFPRLIEVAFPLKQASLDSVHEKNVRHGHISTLHIWPARRPLAACRAALIATLLPDPGDAEERKELSADRREGSKSNRRRRARTGRCRAPQGGNRRRHPALGHENAPTWTGSEKRSRKPTAGARRKCSIPSRAAARSRWRRCAWVAKRQRWTSIRSPGSS